MADPDNTVTDLTTSGAKTHLLSLPAELFWVIYDFAESEESFSARNISRYATMAIPVRRKHIAAKLSRTCRELHTVMEDTLYNLRPFSVLISTELQKYRWSKPPMLDLLTKVRRLHLRVDVYWEKDFRRQNEDLEQVIKKLMDSKQLVTFAFGVEIKGGWVSDEEVEKLQAEMNESVPRSERRSKEAEFEHAMRVVRYLRA